MSADESERNLLLASLSPEDYQSVLTELRPGRLDLRQVLIEPNVPIEDVWFPRSGVASMLAADGCGSAVEVATIGREGFVGVPILHGVAETGYEVLIQVEGDGWRMKADTFRRITDERADVRRACLRYAQHLQDQASQSVACNRLHSLEQRCARWLLTTQERIDGDSFHLTHDFLSIMLGVRRAGVSVAMGVFQRGGIVRYVRGQVTILDRAGLLEASCECYRITHAAFERLFPAEAH